MMRRRLSIILILLWLSAFLGGCWDRRELESLGLVQALGIDRGPGGKGITVSTMIAIPPKISSGGGQSGGSGGGGGTDSGVFIISVDAPTIYEAFNRINTVVNREITLMQTSALFIGEDLARSGLHKWVDTFVRYREMRRTILVFICKGTAAQMMKVQPKLEKNPSEFFTDLSGLTSRTGMFPKTRLHDFMFSYEAYAQEEYAPILASYQPKEPVAPKPKPGGGGQSGGQGSSGGGQSGGGSPGSPGQGQGPSHIRIIGTAIFKKDKMIGTLDNYESQVMLLLSGRFHEAMLSIADPKHKKELIAFRLFASGAPQIIYERRKNQDRLQVRLKLEADILSIQSGVNYTDPSKERYLSKYIAAALKRRIEKVLDKVQHQYQSDVFGFGNRVRASFLTSSEWERYNWPKHFPQAQIHTQVNLSIRRVGVQFAPPTLR